LKKTKKIEENVKYVFTNDAGNSTDSELLQARFENVFETEPAKRLKNLSRLSDHS